MPKPIPQAVGIPPYQRSAVRRLAEMDPADFELILASVSKVPLGSPRRSFTSSISEAVPSIGTGEASTILDVLLSVHSVSAWSGWNAKRVARLIANSPGVDLSDQPRDALLGRLPRVLESDPLAILAKALDVLTENQNLMHEARIVTDIRSVFVGQEVRKPSAAVLIHNLKIEYHSNGEYQEFYVSLDSEDLKTLRATLGRAQQKEEAIRATFDDKAEGFPILANWTAPDESQDDERGAL